jgi:hypothetical protein
VETVLSIGPWGFSRDKRLGATLMLEPFHTMDAQTSIVAQITVTRAKKSISTIVCSLRWMSQQASDKLSASGAS